MKKILIFILICGLSISFTSCSVWVEPANVEVLGYGTVEQDTEMGSYYVEMESAKYAVDLVYKWGKSRIRLWHFMTPPINGMDVTCFKVGSEVAFMTGLQSQESLNNYFACTVKAGIVLSLFLSIIVLMIGGVLIWNKYR